MIIRCNKASLYETKEIVKKGDLLIGASTEHGITECKVYVATKDQGEVGFSDSIFVINDEGVETEYSSEWFSLYEGEKVVIED